MSGEIAPEALLDETEQARLRDAVQHARLALTGWRGEFMERNFAGGLERFAGRLRQIGFTGKRRMLDAGCGWGQWSLAMARLNETVDAVDQVADSIPTGERLAQALGLGNLSFRQADLSALPFADASFDAVFSYSVLYLTRWRTVLSELKRVLAPGGVLYANFPGLGYHLYLWKEEPHKSSIYQPREFAARAFVTTYRLAAGLPLLEDPVCMFTREEVRDVLAAEGFELLGIGDEGTLATPSHAGPKGPSFFKSSYYGEEGQFEILARRR